MEGESVIGRSRGSGAQPLLRPCLVAFLVEKPGLPIKDERKITRSFPVQGDQPLQRLEAFVPKSDPGIIRGQLERGRRSIADKRGQLFQYGSALVRAGASAQQGRLVPAPEIQRIESQRLGRRDSGLVQIAHLAPQGGFQNAGPRVQGIGGPGPLDPLEGLGKVSGARGNFGQGQEGRRPPAVIPGSAVQGILRLVRFAQRPADDSQIIKSFPILGAGVIPGRPFDGPLEHLLRFAVHSSLQIEDRQGDIRAVITRVAPQGLLIIRIGLQGRVIKLLQSQSGQIKLFHGGDILGRPGGRDRRGKLGFFVFSRRKAHQLSALGCDERKGKCAGIDALRDGSFADKGPVRAEGNLFLVDRADPEGQDGPGVGIIAGGIEAQPGFPAFGNRQLAGGVFRRRLDPAGRPKRVPPLFDRARLAGLGPAVIGLVVRKRAEHQLRVGAVRVGQNLFPERPVGAGPPGPQFFSRDEIVVGDKADAGIFAVIVSGQEISLAVKSEKRGRPDVALPPRDVDAAAVILAVEDLRGDGPMGELILAVECGQRRIRGEDDLVIRIGADRRVGETEHGLGQGCAVEDADRHLHGRGIRPQGQADDPFRPMAQLDFSHPDGGASVRAVDDEVVDGQKSRGPVVMGDVPFHPARDPGPQHTDEGRFDDMLAVDEVIPIGFVLGGEQPAADLGQDAQFEVFIFQIDRLVGLVLLEIAQTIEKGVGINRPLGALVGPAVEEHGVGLGGFNEVGGEDERFLPDAGARLGG